MRVRVPCVAIGSTLLLVACGAERDLGGVSGGASAAADSVGDDVPDECIFRVATKGSDSNDGTSWDSAIATVQAALDVAKASISSADCSAAEVWVAKGTYTPTYLADESDDRSATFRLVADVALYGGFSGTESRGSSRDIAANVTILSGDIGDEDDASDNCYHVVTGTTGATLDGFTIAGGNADGDVADCGGGMINVGASPTVARCAFVDNRSTNNGAGMFNWKASPVVTDCTFSNNTGQESGGAIYNWRSSPTVTGCTFTGNSAFAGGAMFNEMASSPTVTRCMFVDNRAGSGGAIYNFGSLLTATDCVFVGNSAEYDGGAMANEHSVLVKVTGCVFADNSAEYGGGMHNWQSYPMVQSCTFSGNAASIMGGGIYNRREDDVPDRPPTLPTIANSILWGDTAGSDVSEIADDGGGTSEPLGTVQYSIIQGGHAAGTNIITRNPLFVDAAGGDWTLQRESPAIDAGNDCAEDVPLTDGRSRWDIAGIDNAADSAVDIGALEYQGVDGKDALVEALDCG